MIILILKNFQSQYVWLSSQHKKYQIIYIYGAKQDNIIVTSASWQENVYATLEYRNKIKIHHNTTIYSRSYI